jgi:quercetin dioxygenase-like cupin family protein
MWMMRLALAALLFGTSALSASGQAPDVIDALEASPGGFKLLLDNEHVRVLAYQLKPGEKDHWHTHPPKVSYVVTGGMLRIHLADGTHFDADETAGTASWMGKLPRHYAENIGKTPVKIVLIEVKEANRTSSRAPAETMDQRANDATRTEVIAVVEKYIDAIRRNDASSLPVHADLIAEFPTNTYRGIESFIKGMEAFSRMVKSIEVVRLVVDGEHCVAILNLDTVFGRIPFAEHIHVVNGAIVSIRGYFDPSPIVNAAK